MYPVDEVIHAAEASPKRGSKTCQDIGVDTGDLKSGFPVLLALDHRQI